MERGLEIDPIWEKACSPGQAIIMIIIMIIIIMCPAISAISPVRSTCGSRKVFGTGRICARGVQQ